MKDAKNSLGTVVAYTILQHEAVVTSRKITLYRSMRGILELPFQSPCCDPSHSRYFEKIRRPTTTS